MAVFRSRGERPHRDDVPGDARDGSPDSGPAPTDQPVPDERALENESACGDRSWPADRQPPRFAPTDHLSIEAVAAFVDNELGAVAFMRATRHLTLCVTCRAEVEAQAAARAALRQSDDVAIPTGLLGSLQQIPTREIDMSADPDRHRGRRRSGLHLHRGPWRDR